MIQIRSDFLPLRAIPITTFFILTGIWTCALFASVPESHVFQPHYLVSDYLEGKILRYNLDGSFLGEFVSGLGRSAEMDIGPDGKLYVSSSAIPAILRFDAITGEQLSSVMSPGVYPRGFTWGPNGNLFVARGGAGIEQFDGRTGAYIGQFANLVDSTALQFDGDLFVSFGELGTPAGIKQFNSETGAHIATFATNLLNMPTDLLLAPNGDFYVSNQGPGPVMPVLRVNRSTGLRDPTFSPSTSFFNPVQLKFSPRGDLLVVDGASTIKRLDPVTGEFLGNLISDSGRLTTVADIVFVNVPEPTSIILWLISVQFIYGTRGLRRLLIGKRFNCERPSA